MGNASDVRAGGAFVEVWGDLSGLQQSLARGRKMMQNWGRSLTLGGGIMAGVGAAMAAPFKAALDAFGVQESAEQRLRTALESSGHAAGYTAEELIGMAQALQKVTAYGDEEIIGAQAMLATFTKIGKDTFPNATEAVLNLAEGMGTDLRSAAIQLGKALNDPATGLNAMVRSGVSFTEKEREMIKTMWEMGRTADAQRYILNALNTQGLGNQARDQLKTYAGMQRAITGNFGDLKEAIGSALRPTRDFMESIRGMLVTAKTWVETHPEVVRAFAAISVALVVLGTAVMALGILFSLLASPVTLFIGLLLVAALAALNLVESFTDVDIGFRDLLEGFRVGTQSMMGWWEILTATLYTSWVDFKFQFVSGLSNMSKLFWKLVSGYVRMWAWMLDKIGADEIAQKLRDLASPFENYEPFKNTLDGLLEEYRHATATMDEIAMNDQERLAKREREKKKWETKAKLPQFRTPEIDVPKLPARSGGIIVALGGANFAERLGQIGRQTTVEDKQLDVMKSMDSTLKKVAKNTEADVVATLG